jgi:DNA-binding GntR family transcriptional regulator
LGASEIQQQAQNHNIERLIADAILEHRLAPGQHLNEAQLAKGFGVSRPAVRFALIGLANDGLLKIEQNRGAFVAKPTLEEAIQLFQALAALEKAATDIILRAEHESGSPDLDALAAIHHRQIEAQRNGQLAESVKLSVEFHIQFVQLTGNHFLLETHRKLLLQYRLVTAVFRTSMNYCALEDHHIKMVALLREGSNVKLKRLIDAHWGHLVLGHTHPFSEPADLLAVLKL